MRTGFGTSSQVRRGDDTDDGYDDSHDDDDSDDGDDAHDSHDSHDDSDDVDVDFIEIMCSDVDCSSASIYHNADHTIMLIILM